MNSVQIYERAHNWSGMRSYFCSYRVEMPKQALSSGEGYMVYMVVELRDQMAEAERLDKAIWRNLEELGYGRFREL